MNTWKVRAYEKGDEYGIVKLQDLDPEENESALERWHWKYDQNPYGFVAVVAESNGDIVGHMGLFFVDMKIGGKIITASQASELMVHPNYRRQGMFLAIGKKLMEEALKANVFFSFGFPNEPAHHGHLQYGWFDASSVPILSCLLSSAQIAKFKRHPLLAKMLSKTVDRYYQRKFPRDVLNFSIHEMMKADERIDTLWKNTSETLDMAVIRNQKFLNWRFVSNPETRYRIFIAENEGVAGYIVIAIRKAETRTIGYIVDFLVSSHTVFRDLIAVALDHFVKEDVASLKCLIQDASSYATLRSYGFASNKYRPQKMIARINSESFDLYNVNRRWFVTYADCDFM